MARRGRGNRLTAALFAGATALAAHGQTSAQSAGNPDNGRSPEGASNLDKGAANGAGMEQRLEQLRALPSDDLKPVDVEDPGTRIRPAAVMAVPERAAPPAPINENRPETLPQVSGKAAAALLQDPVYQERIRDLRRCRGEVAVERRVKPAAVMAGEVLLRWTVADDGRVEDAEVVATAPTDPDVMGCVHRKIEAWQITPPPASAYRVDRRLSFRR
jgi:hypothetical protein